MNLLLCFIRYFSLICEVFLVPLLSLSSKIEVYETDYLPSKCKNSVTYSEERGNEGIPYTSKMPTFLFVCVCYWQASEGVGGEGE